MNIIVYLSPAGTSKQIAGFIAGAIEKKGLKSELFDLSEANSKKSLINAVKQLKKEDCLWIGSPIYAGHILPPVADFLADLPELSDVAAVPFVTYGGVNSGMGLYEMAKVLTNKGLCIPGAAKVLAVHSLLWFVDNPPGKGHPGQEEEQLINKLVNTVLEKIAKTESSGYLSTEDLNYQPQKTQELVKGAGIFALKQKMPPITFDEEKCTSCGICAEVCPTENIRLDPFPVFKSTDTCLFCFNCIRSCETKALDNKALSIMEKMIAGRIKEFAEPAETKIFV